jgi:holliday junction resolvase Hjr
MARNTNRQGAQFELDVMHYLAGTLPERWGQGFGYDCLRSSGSRGKVDVVAITPAGGWVEKYLSESCGLLFIQCKITNPLISPAERLGIQDLALRAGALPLVAHRAKDVLTGRVRPHFRQLTGPGPKDWLPWEPGEDD